MLQEEYERTGMCEEVMPHNPEKPLPQEILKTFSLGLKSKNIVAELSQEGKEILSSLENDVSVSETDVNILKLITDAEHLSCSAGKKIITSLSQQRFAHKEDIGAASVQGNVCPKLSCGSQVHLILFAEHLTLI